MRGRRFSEALSCPSVVLLPPLLRAPPPPPISNPGPLNLITFPDIGRFLQQPRHGREEVGRSVRSRGRAGGCDRTSAWADPGANFGKARAGEECGSAARWGEGGVRTGLRAGPRPRTCPPSVPASAYRGRSDHGIRVTVSRDVDMKRKVDASSVIQSLSHPAAAASPQQGTEREGERRGKKVVAPGSLGGLARSCYGGERSVQL